MFDENYFCYKNIISNIAILGYSESDIIARGINTSSQLELTCLFSYPEQDESSYNQMTYEMMFPDKNYNIECPKFFSLSLTDELGNRSYLYCLKFPEKYTLENFKHPYEINVPIVICIKSNKSDLEPFRQLLTSINQIIVSENIEHGPNIVNDYKKVELLNIFYFIFSLPHTPPHSLVRLKLNNDLCEVEKEIDFYFSSNCEIPCNKNDTDINLLFLILDQSIIIKVIIAILQEKQIIFRASQAYILHLIIPTFLKLIFPFRWQQTLVTILPNNEAENYLDTPGSFIFGILSNALELNEIIEKYPGKIIVDCDTNEIFGEEANYPFVPDEEKINTNNTSKKKKEKFVFNNIDGDIKQGKNIFIVDGSYIYQYDPESNTGKGRKMKFNNKKHNIIIDTQNSQLLIQKNNDFITNSEIKSLRKNIQLVRNPEIFDIENIGKKDNNDNKIKETDSLILPNRPFSYNIQNILLHFYLTKISDKGSKFMQIFEKSNLYTDYLNPKKFQNNSGKKIIENIKETMDNQSSIENCFIIEYNKSNFSALLLIDDIDKKITQLESQNTINEKIDEVIYKELRTILMNYCTVLGIKLNNQQNKTEINTIDLNSKKTKVTPSKNIIKRGHVKSNNSLLQFTLNRSTTFNLEGVDKSSKDYFKFYKKDGFLKFIENMNKIKTNKGKKPGDLHQLKIFRELLNKFKELENIFMDQKKEEEENEVIIDVLDENFEEEEKEENEINENEIKIQNDNKKYELDLLKINKNKLLEELQCSTNNLCMEKQLSMIDENENEENNNTNTNDSFIDKSVKTSDNKDQENLGNIIMNSLKSEENLINIKENDEYNNLSNSENIINFPGNENKISNENNNFLFLQLNNDKNLIETLNLTQYYLFLAFYLEQISFSEDLLDKFDKEIMNSVGIRINIYKLILKLYKEAYKQSGEKHRDFPYYNFYSFLQGLNDKNLSKVEDKLAEDDYNFSELLDIYQNIMNKRKIKLSKERKDNKSIINDRAKSLNPSKYSKFDSNIIEPKVERISQKPKIFTNSLIIPLKENNYDFSEAIIINKDFQSKVKPDNPLDMFYLFCISMQTVFPSQKDIQSKSIQQIIDEANINIDSSGLIEFLAELKNVDLKQIKSETDKFCFWLNCFNFLLLFAIFYLKVYNLGKDLWENFLKNIQYNIGGNNYSLEDMSYVLFKKKIFFQKSKYTPKNYVKKNSIDFSKEKNIFQDAFPLLPLLLYIPTKEFFKITIYAKSDLQDQIFAKITTSILTMILWNERNKALSLSGLLFIFDPNFLNKGYSKYKDYIKNDIYKILKGKKYKKLAKTQIKWELCFDNLLEYKFIEE